jgi:succinate-semialdehyde dehydrogenase/glutarate-semialdehyde dehydrogenase
MPQPHDPDAARRALDSVPGRAFLAGAWVDTGSTFDVTDPASGDVIAEVADAGPGLFHGALDAAADTQRSFADLAPRTRAEILRRTYDLLQRDKERLALIMTLEMGKPLGESAGEVDYASEFFRWFAEETCHVGGDYRRAPNGNGRILVSRRPVGPCLLITPWNFPLAMGARKIAPAIAAGCTAILKPAGATPLTSLALAGVLAEAGLPMGALSVLPTSASGAATEPLFADRRLRKLSFTGSTEVGRGLLRQAADGVLKVSMELGGNAPFLVFDDADVDAAVEGALLAKMRNGGEACTSANRFLVHEAVADEFATKLTGRVAAMRVGHGTDPATDVGPLIDEAARTRILAAIEGAADEGAVVRTGGTAVDGPGWFLEPTVVTGVADSAPLAAEEIFGPVVAISTFAHDDDAIDRANGTDFGLVSYAYTSSLDRALRLGEAIETGMLGINRGVVSDPAAPFGGVKSSGLGREGGRTGIDEYQEWVYTALP